MTDLVFYLVVFLAVGVFFLFIHLMIGKLIRPYRPDPEKMTIYECGEPTVGSAWIQFDLRYYVVALLFVIFDVEVAFFFPWAVVFGKSNELSQPTTAEEQRAAVTKELVPTALNLAYLEAEQPADAEQPAAPPKKGPPAGKKGPGGKKGGKAGIIEEVKKAVGKSEVAQNDVGKAKIAKLAKTQAPALPDEQKKKDLLALGQDLAPPISLPSREPPKDVRPIDAETARTWAWIAF